MACYQIAIRCILHIVRDELFLGAPSVTSASSFCVTSWICSICFRINLHVLWSLSLAWRQLVPQLHWTTRGFHEPTLTAASCCWRQCFRHCYRNPLNNSGFHSYAFFVVVWELIDTFSNGESCTITPIKTMIFLSGNATTVISLRILLLFSVNEVFHNFCWIFRKHVTITHCSVWWRGWNLNTLCCCAGRLRSGDTGPHSPVNCLCTPPNCDASFVL
jgi:hypothetical protein